MATTFVHHPALLDESLTYLDARPDAVIVDGTVGGGGHAAAILERTAPHGLLIAIDRDAQALAATARRLEPCGDRVRTIHASFRRLTEVLAELDVSHVDGVLLDLGVSSPQLDEPGRGFRFSEETAKDTPLDMRMDPREETSAAQLLTTLSVAPSKGES